MYVQDDEHAPNLPRPTVRTRAAAPRQRSRRRDKPPAVSSILTDEILRRNHERPILGLIWGVSGGGLIWLGNPG